MTKLILGLSWLIALAPLLATAQVADVSADATVTAMLDTGDSHAQTITRLRDRKQMSLAEATVFALVSGGQDNRVAFARAGVASAANVTEAEGVVAAVVAVAGETDPAAEAARRELGALQQSVKPPATYRGSGIAYGGDSVSPST